MASFASRLLVLDTESTGTDTATDRIVELAAVYFVDRAYEGHRQMLLDPERPIPAEASAIHGITDERVRGKPRFADVAVRFLAHVDGVEHGGPPWLVGYNALGYDLPLLNAELARAGLERVLGTERLVDPMIFVRYHLRHLRQRSLGALCEHYGISLADAHRAAADARATGELLLRMVREGLLPDDVDEALALQARHAAVVEAEWNELSYWLYRDREHGALRIGAGKHCGRLLDEVEPSYLAYLLRTIADLPEAVRRELQARSAR